VAAEAADATGLPEGCEVRLGMTDACASQLAAGASSPGQFVSVLGSTLVLKGASTELVTDPAGAVYSHRHPDGWWLPGGASNTGAKALADGFPDGDLAALDRRAAEHGPARCVRYPLVGRGERFPFAASEAEGFELGQPEDDVERYRATLEGVAFVERLGYERLRSLGADAEPPVAASGGGSRSRIWNRIRATVLGFPLVEKPDASTAAGACILAAAGSVHPDLATACREMGVEGDQVEPDDGERDALEASYQRLVEAVSERGWLG
jgi:sugar (pentulose or hexulose) kinase